MTTAAKLLQPLVRALGHKKLTILIYHRVHQISDPIFPGEVDAQRFNAHLDWLTSLFRVLPLTEAIEQLKDGTLPSRAACITFDDGYADNAEVALPLLLRHRAPATFFISSGFLDGGRMWNDTIIEAVRRAPGDVLDLTSSGFGQYDIATAAARRAAIEQLIKVLKYLPQEKRTEKVEQIENAVGESLPDNLMLRSEQVRELSTSGMTVGGHTVSHPILTRLVAAQAKQEIEAGRDALQAITGKPITLFAYPNGKPGEDYSSEHVAMVRELGFQAAVSIAWGAASSTVDLFQLPRFTPWDETALGFSLRLTGNLLRKPGALPA